MTDELLDMLALHAVDQLEKTAAFDLEEHLAEGCALCAQHLVEFRNSFASLAHAAPSVKPAGHVREQLIAAVHSSSISEQTRSADNAGPQVWKAWTPQVTGAPQVVRRDDQKWESVRPGICAKQLYLDVERDTVTMLVRMDPGSSYIPHRHGGPEQCYVLEGDLRDGELVVYAGDYQCAASGSIHGAQSTMSGCLLLIVSSLRDELL